MHKRSPLAAVIVVLLSVAISLPPQVAAQAPQRAGEISRLIPTVDIARGSQQLSAELKSPVDWGDSIQTQADGRARVALDDGSVLNVGADSTFQVTQHNPGDQQTQVDLTYGRIRSKVVHLTRPGAKFEVHTPVGVAGVVGTDFIVFYENEQMQLLVIEGLVHFCNTTGLCTDVAAGQFSTIRSGHPPDPPSPATDAEVAEAVAGTSLDGASPGNNAPIPHHVNPWVITGVVVGIVVPSVVIPIVTRNNTPTNPCAGVGVGVAAPCGAPK
jgi:hypothetical protein